MVSWSLKQPHLAGITDDKEQKLADIDWRPLNELDQDPEWPSLVPFEMRFPDHTTCYVNRHKAILVLVASWLYGNRNLRIEDCPVAKPQATKRYVVNNTPHHKNGDDFKQAKKAGPLCVETNNNSCQMLKDALFLIKEFAPRLEGEFYYSYRWGA